MSAGLARRLSTAWAAHHRTEVLIGCASLPGVDPQAIADRLSFAFHYAAAEPEWAVAARGGRGVPMDLMPRSAVDPRAVMAGLPPLLKAYVRIGSRFAREAVTDHQFGCTDLFTVLPLASADPRHLAHFGPALNPLS